MAFPVVETTATGFTTSTEASYAVPLPSGIKSGDLLLIIIVLRINAARTLTTPSGWTELFSIVPTGNLRRFAAYYKVASGSEGASVTVSASSGAVWSTNAYRISGYRGAPEATTNSGSSSESDPPSLSPSWGEAQTLWIAADGDFSSSATAPSAPTNYTNLVSVVADSGSGNRSWTATARRELIAATENPGVFTLGGSGPWAAATIAVAPAAVIGAEAGSVTLTGQDVGLLRGYRAAVEAAAFEAAGQDVSLRAARRLEATASAFSLAGQAASFRRTSRVAVVAGVFTLTGRATAIGGVVEAGAFVLTGCDAELRATRRLVVEDGSIVLTGRDAALQRHFPLIAQPAVFLLNGQDVELRSGFQFPAEAGAVLLVGQDVAFVRARSIAAEAGVFVLLGKNVALERAIGAARVLFVGGVSLGFLDSATGAHPSRTQVTRSGVSVDQVTADYPARASITSRGFTITRHKQIFH